MSEIDLISSLLDKVAKKQRVDTVPQRLDEMLQILDSWEDSGTDDDSRAAALASLGSKLEAVGVAQGESSTARELESSVRKLGKAVCKAMPQPTLPDVPLDDGALVQVLYVHMLCAGRFDVALALEREAADAIAAPTLQLRAPLEALHAALSALRARDLSPALAWAADHRERLEALGSRLPFLLARLAFVSHLEKGETLAALALARERLLPLALGEGCRSPRGKIELSATVLRGAAAGECAHGIAAVRSLMGSLAFAPALRGSRYEWLLEPSLAEEACEALTCEALAALGLLDEPPETPESEISGGRRPFLLSRPAARVCPQLLRGGGGGGAASAGQALLPPRPQVCRRVAVGQIDRY